MLLPFESYPIISICIYLSSSFKVGFCHAQDNETTTASISMAVVTISQLVTRSERGSVLRDMFLLLVLIAHLGCAAGRRGQYLRLANRKPSQIFLMVAVAGLGTRSLFSGRLHS
jgi:hypothetical protein